MENFYGTAATWATIIPDRHKVEKPKREENVFFRFHKFSKNTCNENIEKLFRRQRDREHEICSSGRNRNNEEYCATRVRGERIEKVPNFENSKANAENYDITTATATAAFVF